MLSLAKYILLYEWKKTLAAIITVTAAIMIVVAQIGIIIGLSENATFVLKNAGADIWITSPQLESFDTTMYIDAKYALPPLIIPEVEKVNTIASEDALLEVNGTARYSKIWGFDTEKYSLGFPKIFGDKKRQLLNSPLNVLLDESVVKNEGLKVGDILKINRVNVTIVGIIKGFPGNQPVNIIASKETSKRLSYNKKSQIKYILIKLKDPNKKLEVQTKLQEQTGEIKYIVWQNDELYELTKSFWLEYSTSGQGFMVSCIIGVIVALIVTNQIIKMLVLGNLKEYGALRALGVGFFAQGKVILEKCFWIGLLSCSLSVIIIKACIAYASYNNIPFSVPLNLIVISFSAIFLICFLSGLLSLRSLYKYEPADLLR